MNPFYFRPPPSPYMLPYAYMRPPLQVPVQAPVQAGAFESFLTNANSLMTNAQKFTPYVQQLTPMVKNLPAIWRMYKSFKQAPAASEQQSAPPIEKSSTRPVTRNRNAPPQTSAQLYTPRPSVPKIYQPTWP